MIENVVLNEVDNTEEVVTEEIVNETTNIVTNTVINEINNEIRNFDSLIMDFTDLEYISSAGLRVLIDTQKKLKAENIPFAIKNVHNAVGEIFRMSGFDKILKIE